MVKAKRHKADRQRGRQDHSAVHRDWRADRFVYRPRPRQDTLNTLPPAALAVVQLVLYVYFRHTEYFMTPAGALSKAYSNSLLVVINNRREARDPRSGPGNDLTLPPQLTSTRAIQINVNQETFAEGNMAVVNLSTDDKVRCPSVSVLTTQSNGS